MVIELMVSKPIARGLVTVGSGAMSPNSVKPIVKQEIIKRNARRNFVIN